MASQYLARLGIVLGVDSGELVTGIDAAKKQFKEFANQVEKDTKAALREVSTLKDATDDYGKTLTKVQQIEREINKGRFMYASQNVKDMLLAEAKAYDAKAASMQKMNSALSSQQKLQVSYQLTDFFTQIASGQNAMIAFIQQGGQLKDSMGGVGNAFRAITSLITPMRIALGGVLAVFGSLAYAIYQGGEESKKFNQAMALTNDFAGISQARFDGLSISIARNFTGSVSDARDMMMALTASGKFTYTSMVEVANVIGRIAQLSGDSASSVADKLIPSLDGSASSAKKLNDTYHFLNLEQLKQIENLEKQGQMQKAVALTADLLTKSLDDHVIRLGYLEKLWRGVKEGVSEFWDWMKSIGREEDPTMVLLKRQAAYLEKLLPNEKAIGTKRLQEELQKYKDLAALVQAEEDKQKAKSDQKAKEGQEINDYLSTGGSDRSVQMTSKLAQTRYNTWIEWAKQTATEDQRIQLEATQKIAEKAFAYEALSAQEKRARGKQLQEQLSADVLEINAERDRKLADLAYKRYLKELDYQVAAMRHQEEVDNQLNQKKIDAQLNVYRETSKAQDEVKYQSDLLHLQMEMIGATEKEKGIAEEKLKIEKEIAQWKRSEEYGLLSKKDQDYYEKQKRGVSEARIENLKFMESLKYMQGMYDAVWSNMSSAIENFVRTGKFSIKDFTRSVIQDMLIMNMKLQAMTLLRGLLGRLFAGPSANPSQYALNFTGMKLGPGHAAGGPVDAGTAYPVGEKGPELFIPRSAGTIIPNNQLAGIGGSTTVNNTYINAIDAKSFEQRLLESSNTIWAANTYANKTLASNGRRA